jgi:hypothetical protein
VISGAYSSSMSHPAPHFVDLKRFWGIALPVFARGASPGLSATWMTGRGRAFATASVRAIAAGNPFVDRTTGRLFVPAFADVSSFTLAA